MENKICNNCGSFFIMTDRNKIKRYHCSFKNMLVRPSESCDCWHQAKLEREVKQTEEGVSATIRVWNPRSRRHEDVKAE